MARLALSRSSLVTPKGPLRGPVGPLPGVVYDAPLLPGAFVASPPPPRQTLTPRTDSSEPYESILQQVSFSPGAGDNTEQVVFATSQRWKGIDVYIDTTALNVVAAGGNGQPYVGIAIYGIIAGMRTLLSTGRTRAIGTTVGFAANSPSQHIGALRVSMAERFEVTVFIASGTISSVSAGMPPTVNVGIIASDDAGLYADDSAVGVINFNAGTGVSGDGGLTTNVISRINGAFPGPLSGVGGFAFVGVQGTNIVGAARWLQLHAPVNGGGVPLVGNVPAIAWSLPAAGSMVFGTESKIFGALGRRNWCLAVSTTGPTFTAAAAGDVAFNGYAR